MFYMYYKDPSLITNITINFFTESANAIWVWLILVFHLILVLLFYQFTGFTVFVHFTTDYLTTCPAIFRSHHILDITVKPNKNF